MHEPLTTQLVAELMRDLLAAFPSKHSERNLAHTADVYRNGLRGVSGTALRAAVNVAIQSDTYFPKVARLRELATEWQKRNTVSVIGAPKGAWNVCGICGAHATERSGQAQDRDARGALLWLGTDASGKRIPKMIETPPRYVMEHIPGPHAVRLDAIEEVG